jgi:hypothetical protein
MPFSPTQRAKAGFMFGTCHFPIGRNQLFIPGLFPALSVILCWLVVLLVSLLKVKALAVLFRIYDT